MASGGRPPQRISSQQARDLIEKIAENSDTDSLDSFSSDGDSYHESNNDSSDSDASSAPTPAKPTSSTTDGPPTSKVPRLDTSRPTSSGDTYQQMFCTFVAKSTPTVGKGKGNKGKKGAVRVTTADATTSEASTSQWRSVSLRYDSEFDRQTGNNFRFVTPRPPGVNANLDETSTAFECLQTLLDDDVIDFLVKSINEYADMKSQMNNPPKRRSMYADFQKVDKEEFWRFFTVLIVIGLNKKPRIRDYFTKNPAYWYTPWFYQIFPSRDRFMAIYHTMLHAGDACAQKKEKIEPFMTLLIDNFKKAFYPFEDLSIDEMVIGFKGRWANKQFNASKPHKYHIKTFGLCDSVTGYVYNLLLYYGQDTSYIPEADTDSLQAKKVFQTLLTDLGKGHTVFADRYYTAKPVIDYLQERQMYFTGTLQVNRKDFPQELKKMKLKHRESKWFMSEKNEILCVAWRDKKAKKPCVLVSTKSEASMVDVDKADTKKPQMVLQYNKAMNGCDRVDQNVSYYGVHERRSKKWWKKIFFWLLEIAQFNASVLYTLSHPDVPRLGMRVLKQKLIECIEQQIVIKNVSIQPAQMVKFERFDNSVKHLIQFVEKARNCKVCSKPGDRNRTHFTCSGCSDRPYLHPKDCFYEYHTEV